MATKSTINLTNSSLTRNPEQEALCINEHRFQVEGYSTNMERIALNFFLKRKSGSHESLKKILMDQILCMDLVDNSKEPLVSPLSSIQPTGYSRLSPEKRELAKLLKDNERVVEIVFNSFFQWLGTGVGRSDVENLVKTFEEYDRKLRDKESKTGLEEG